MCTAANLILISYQNGVLLRMGQHGDRSYVEHDGVIVSNTLPSDVSIEIATEGVGKALIEWGKKNLVDFLYRHDYMTKEVMVSFADKVGNSFAGKFSADVPFEEILNFIGFGDRNDLRFRSNKSEKDHTKLISEVQDLKSTYAKAKKVEEEETEN